jgi:hypothetical protein
VQRVHADHVVHQALREDALGKSLGVDGYNFLHVIEIEDTAAGLG